LTEYNAINDEVLRLLQHEQVRQGVTLKQEELDAYLLALYRLDEFRRTVSRPDFFNKYLPDDEERRSVLADDLSLLRFGIRWLQEILFTK
jgi:bacterioferritin (cytochrome b1)